jgi:ABC-type cobalt transport system substrate-binding protein
LTWKPYKKVDRYAVDTLPDAQWLKVIEAHGRRNELAPKLLATQPYFGGAESDANEEMNEIDPCLVPTIFAVLHHAPRTAANVMFVGLMGVLGGDVIRPLSH